MRSEIDVWNTALGRLGGNQFNRENTVNGDSAQATLCRTFYPHVLDMCLSSSMWGFARKTVHLAMVDGNEPTNPAYPYRFALPSDCVRPVRLLGNGVMTGDFWQSADETWPFEIVGNNIMTDTETATLVYISRVTDVASWPATFADAVAWALASELATALINDPNRQQMYGDRAKSSLDQAAAVENNSQNKRRIPSAWLMSRQD